MTRRDYLPLIEGQLIDLLSGNWVGLDDACADSNLRYPGVYLLAFSERQLAGTKIEVRDVFYVGMSIARNGVKQRLRQFRDGIERNDHHSGAMRFYRDHANGLAFSKLKTVNRFYAAARVTQCERVSADDWRDMGHVACLEYYVVAHVVAETGEVPRLNLAKERKRLLAGELAVAAPT